MPLSPVPSSDELLRLYSCGELVAEVCQHHETENGQENLFVQRCVALHNCGSIDFVGLVHRPEFSKAKGHSFFAALHHFCQAIPELIANSDGIMDCCRVLVDMAGADGAAARPYFAFHKWCQNNMAECISIINRARFGDQLSIRFVKYALQASNDISSAKVFAIEFQGARRLSGIMALSGMIFIDANAAHTTALVLERLISSPLDEESPPYALVAAFDMLKGYPDATIANKLFTAATNEPTPHLLHALSEVVWLHKNLLDASLLQIALSSLMAVRPERSETMHILDMGLAGLLSTPHDNLALDFLTEKLSSGEVEVEAFGSVSECLVQDNPQRLYELIVKWLLSGKMALCNSVEQLLRKRNKLPFDTTARPLKLSSTSKLFLCRKAIGFLFFSPALCCSIIVSILRANDKKVESPISDLLFDPILINYWGEAKEYLNSISTSDLAFRPVRRALSKAEKFYANIDAIGLIREFRPSDRRHNLVAERIEDEFRIARKKAEEISILRLIAHRSTILHGKRSVTYLEDPDGTHRAVTMDLKSFSTSIEMPRREIIDPVGLDYVLRILRVEKLK